MASDGRNDQRSYLYLGLAGETGPGRPVHTGLCRLADGSDEWELLQRGLPEAPAVRALAVHPLKPEIVYAGTQAGPYRSADHGEHWEKVELPDHGLPVWSLLFHPHDPDVIFVGYENCEIYRSDDAGGHWARLPVSVRFRRLPRLRREPGKACADDGRQRPSPTTVCRDRGGRYPALHRRRRALGKSEPWPIRQRRHRRHARRAGQPLAAQLGLRHRPGRHVPQCRLRRPLADRAARFAQRQGADLLPRHPRGSRQPRKLWVAAGAGFQSDVGVLLRSSDGGDSWTRVDIGLKPAHTMFALAFDERRPAQCRAPPMAARFTAAGTAARVGSPTRGRRAARKFTLWPAAERARETCCSKAR